MNPIGLLGLTRGFFLEFLRDRTALYFSLIFPPIFTLVIAVIISAFAGSSTFSLGLVRQDDSASARAVSQALQLSPAFAVSEGDLDAEMAALRLGKRQLVLDIAPGYGSELSERGRVVVEVYFDEGDPATRQVAVPALAQILDSVDRRLAGSRPRVELEPIPLLTRKLDTIDFVGPGIIAFSIMQLGVFSAVAMVARREKKILKRVAATPATKTMVLVANIAVRVVVSAVQTTSQILILVLGFGLDFANPLPIAAVLLLGTLVFVGLGFSVASFAPTAEAMLPIVQLISLPMFVLAGVFFPLDEFPRPLQWLATLLPLTYLADAVRQLMIDTAGRYAMGLNLGMLVAWIGAGFAIAVWRFRWE